MPGKVNGTGKVRAELEDITLALVDMEEVLPFVRQRIEQAIRRAALTDLLAPALEDLDRIVADATQAKAQVGKVISTLMARQ
jgi:hypothetical protein